MAFQLTRLRRMERNRSSATTSRVAGWLSWTVPEMFFSTPFCCAMEAVLICQLEPTNSLFLS